VATELLPKAVPEIKDSIIKGAQKDPTDAHVVRNILVQMLVNTRTPSLRSFGEEQVEKTPTLYKDLATYLGDS
jgi:hypothetical protein